MGALGGSTSSSSSGTSSGQGTLTYDPSTMNYWNALMGLATNQVVGPSGVGGLLDTSAYPSASSMVAPMTDVMTNYLVNANAAAGVNPYNTMQGYAGKIQGIGGDLYNAQVDPNSINMPSYNAQSFQPQNTMGGIAALGQNLFGNIPQVQGNWNIPYQNVSAPQNAVNQLSGLPQVTAPNLNYYQLNPSSLQQIGRQQSWTDPGVSQQYMSPYTQNVVNAQLAQAKVQEQQQLQQQNAAATQAGAFGGSRAAVEAANTSIGYQQLASQLEAQGLQNAYTQGAQQFNTQQALGMQGLLANQQTALQAGSQNLAANLQTQGLAAQTSMQGQLANQQTALQSGIANQQAQEFTAGQQLQASLANQQAGIQTGVVGSQLGMQGQMANQAAAMQAKGLQYQGGAQALGQTQALGLQGAIAGGQLGLTAAQAQAGLQQAQQQINQQAMLGTAGLNQMAGNMGLAGYGSYLQGLGAVGQAAGAAQGLAQMTPDAQLASFLMQKQLPIQGLAALATLMAMRPAGYTTGQAGTYSGTQQTSSNPGIMGILGGVGNLLGSFGLAKGGRVPSGIGRYQTGGVTESPPATATPYQYTGKLPMGFSQQMENQFQQQKADWAQREWGPFVSGGAAPSVSGLGGRNFFGSLANATPQMRQQIGGLLGLTGMARGGITMDQSTEGGSTRGERGRLRSVHHLRDTI